MLEAHDIGVTIASYPILTGIDFSLGPGELVALVGPNGSGKTTLLGTLSGDLLPTNGRITFKGRALEEWKPLALARERAVLPQRVTVSFPFLAKSIVAMGRAPWAATPRENEDDNAVAEAMELTECAHLADREYPTLSGGEQARVSLARVLAQRTSAMFLDEPTAALDLHHQELVLQVLRQRAAAGAGIVVVLHDLALAGAYADRLVLLSRGAVAAEGSAADVLTPALLSDVYRHRVDVFPHPVSGEAVVMPRRDRAT